MSGDSQRSEESDFLDDDFVVEDIAGKNDNLDDLFVDPPAGAAAPKPPGDPDADDVLFTDHTAGLSPSEQFQGKGAFAEANPSDWAGEQLELDSDAPATPNAAPNELAAAEQAFTEELGGMLQAEEELGIGDQELELVDGPSAPDGISEIEQSGPFVLDEGDGVLEDAAAEATAEETGAVDEVGELTIGETDDAPDADPREVAKGIWEAVKDPAMAEVADDDAGAATNEPGWEPLPEASVDQLSEVGEVAAVDGAEAQPDQAELAAVDGHDIYSGETAPVLVGPRPGRLRRASGLVAALAASLALVGLGAVVVMRPEWVGLHLEPVAVQQVQLQRPRVTVAVAAPAPVVVRPQVAKADPVVTPPVSPEVTPAPTTPPVAQVPTEVYGPPLPPEPALPAPELPTAVAVVPAPAGQPEWPAARPAEPVRGPKARKGALVRVGDDVMLGDDDASAPGRPGVVDGVVPGARAFAQLQNGNFFIGSVKVADSTQVTLRVNDGEVTLPKAEIVRLTPLGSADYDALQKATSGFVRLTNSNKLVGGILSQIADDHIVLEFRSNRVMLPKSVVGEVVQGEEEQEIRLDVTREEDDWVKSLVERQLGGTAPKVAPRGQAAGQAQPAPQPAR